MNILSIEYLIVLAGLFVLGSVFGSMLNVCIYRLPREERLWPALRSVVYPPSHCPRCQTPIRFYDNVPIFGWLNLRGRCRHCRGAISIRYPLIELLTATLFAALYAFEVPSWWAAGLGQSSVYHELGPTGPLGSAWMSPIALLHWRYGVHLVLVIALIAATFIDIDLRIIPDAVTLPAMAFGALANCLLGQVFIVPLWYKTKAMGTAAVVYGSLVDELVVPRLLPGWSACASSAVGVPAWMTEHPHLHGLCVSLAGIVMGGGIIWAVRVVGQWALKREAMGFGDVVLMAMIGSYIGWQGTVVVFALSLLSAVLIALPLWVAWRNHELPFGPYLALGTLLLLVTARSVWPWFDSRVFALGPLLVPMAVFMAASLAAMLVAWRTIQRLLGLDPMGTETEAEVDWGPGDQLAYLAGENGDDRQGRWPHGDWPGRLAGRGQGQHHVWRYGDGSRPAHRWQKSR